MTLSEFDATRVEEPFMRLPSSAIPGYFRSLRVITAHDRTAVWLAPMLAILLLGSTQSVEAVPSFTHQTGQHCATCHTAFPELTPFGRNFKLTGYTMEGGTTTVPLTT